MSIIDSYLRNNSTYAESHEAGLPSPPAHHVAVVACMDARIDVYAVLGLSPGDAHVIRNAGGVVTEDVIRSLAVSQRLLGTTEVMLIHHTGCGMLGLDDRAFRQAIYEDVGITPTWSPEGFEDLEGDVRQSVRRIQTSPFLPHTGRVRGFIFDVATGLLREVR